MKKKNKIFFAVWFLTQSLVVLALVALSCEILVRRWWLGEIPTQVSSAFVYSILAANFALPIIWLFSLYKLLKQKISA